MKWRVPSKPWSEYTHIQWSTSLHIHVYTNVHVHMYSPPPLSLFRCVSSRSQRKATKKEAYELDEEMESRLNAANANLQIQVCTLVYTCIYIYVCIQYTHVPCHTLYTA